MLRKNCIFPDQAARSPSCSSPLPLEPIEFRCGADSTIVTPCVPSPRARVFNGAISCPLRGPLMPSSLVAIVELMILIDHRLLMLHPLCAVGKHTIPNELFCLKYIQKKVHRLVKRKENRIDNFLMLFKFNLCGILCI